MKSTSHYQLSVSFVASTRSSNSAKLRATRVDNGPEYVSGKLMEWAEKQGVTISHIQPGKPQQNAYVERYNRTIRHEWPDQHIIESIEEAPEFATQWLWTYNNERPDCASAASHPHRN